MELTPTVLLVASTVGISFYAWSNPTFYDNWILDPYRTKRNNDWYRFITSGFLHADFGHLLFNMIALFSFGRTVEFIFLQQFGFATGILYFLLLYLGGIVVSDIPTYLRHRHDPGYRSLGASGGVSSVVFSAILFNPLGKMLVFPLPFEIPSFIFGFLYLGYSYYMGRRRGDNINHDAHFYGALYGLILTVVLLPQVIGHFWYQIQGFIS
ncbi:rhomboid family intramembrane serine protease [Hymenobacter metallilatus]|uniref:Rhomboid family intramembrane serine protease n=1 Tax=Hymenobacter metallilatus TaxID=2493666 RepID=A0A428JU38_9BACT|nr:rhomboid family intramembrane serine protease [Hymenobacter metallilatus]RSK37643.1 rhomboid family intramembrane serine protease [Hymenobacter metallilatus]